MEEGRGSEGSGGRGGKRGRRGQEREGGEGRREEAFLVMWPRRLSALNPPLSVWHGMKCPGSRSEWICSARPFLF